MRLLEDILDIDQGAPRALQALEDPSPTDLNRYPGRLLRDEGKPLGVKSRFVE
jgi:hypothetical protein